MTTRGQMRIKSYFAKSVDQAMAQAREEMGEEAMLLNTRKAPAGSPGEAGYEVVFGLAEESPEAVPEAAKAPGDLVPVRINTIHSAAPEQFGSELERLREQMDEIRSLLLRSSRAQLTVGRALPELAEVYARLTSADVEPELSKDIVDRLEASLSTDAFIESAGKDPLPAANRWKSRHSDSGRLETFLRLELERRVGLAPRFGNDGDNYPVVVLVGPRGAGKTTSLAKLAVSRARFTTGRPARMLSLDMSRAAAHLQLQSVSKTFGIAFQEVPAAYLLPGLIAETRQKETIFVDTPGYAGIDGAAADAAAAAFAECPHLDVHLVVPAYMKARDLRLCIERYAPFRPSKLLVTKLDETQALGSVFSEAARAGLKLSFVGYGPRIPHDIRAASGEDLVSMAMDRVKARAQSVA